MPDLSETSAVMLSGHVEILPGVRDIDEARKMLRGLGDRLAEALAEAVAAERAGQRAALGRPLSREDVTERIGRVILARRFLQELRGEMGTASTEAAKVAAAELDEIDDPDDPLSKVAKGARRLTVPFGGGSIGLAPGGKNVTVPDMPAVFDYLSGVVAVDVSRLVEADRGAVEGQKAAAEVERLLAEWLPTVWRRLAELGEMDWSIQAVKAKTSALAERRPTLARRLRAAFTQRWEPSTTPSVSVTAARPGRRRAQEEEL